MKRLLLLLFLICCIIVLASCDKVDPSGFVTSSDVDARFTENASLPEKAGLTTGSSFSFVVISDPHVYHANHSKLAALKDKLLPSDQFILCCGDQTQCGSAEDYTAFGNYLNTYGIPYYTTLGNHDLYYSGWDNYKAALGRSCYTFTAGPLRLVAVDTANATVGGKQKAWLEQLLQTKTDSLCFVFTHYELFNPGLTDIEEVYYLMHLFETCNVQYVFMGHTHEFYSKVINGVHYISLPGFEDNDERAYIRVFINGTDVTFERLTI